MSKKAKNSEQITSGLKTLETKAKLARRSTEAIESVSGAALGSGELFVTGIAATRARAASKAAAAPGQIDLPKAPLKRAAARRSAR